MIKIYNAYSECGTIKIEDYIEFKQGIYGTGYNGFGNVIASNLNCKKANYELQSLKRYREYLQGIKKEDGYILDFMLWNPVSYEMLEEQYGNIDKDNETYEKYGLNEEAILLFTDYLYLNYPKDNSVQRIFGRYPETGMYLIMPNATFDMRTGSSKAIPENYEVLQSQALGKRLSLVKMDRKI